MLLTLLSKSLHDASFLWPFSSSQPPTNKFKQIWFQNIGILWHSNWTVELTTVEYLRMKKLDSETKIRITWWEIRPRDQKFVRFRWSFELQEFELHEFNCKLLFSEKHQFMQFLMMVIYKVLTWKIHLFYRFLEISSA